MIIILKNDLVLHAANGDKIVELHAGLQLTVIRWEYLPKSAFEGKAKYEIENAMNNCFVVYIKGKFIAIPRNICEIPITTNNGWTYNL